MSGYRRVLFALLSVVAAVLVFERSSSSETATGKNQGQLGEGNICNDNGGHQEKNVCNDNNECDDEGNNHHRCVSFCRQIQPIFDNRCTTCHNPDLFRGMLDLTAGNSYANLVNQPTSPACMATVPDSVRVVPCDPMASMLWLKTLPDDSRCGRPMPFGTDGLGVIAPDEFALIERWILQGAPDN